jgi:hypothetical protein
MVLYSTKVTSFLCSLLAYFPYIENDKRWEEIIRYFLFIRTDRSENDKSNNASHIALYSLPR